MFGFFLVILVVYFQLKSKEEIPEQPMVPSITPVQFQLKSAFPSQEKQKMANPKIALQFKFSEPIDLSSIKCEINPSIFVDYSTNEFEDILYITPKDQWSYNKQYKILLDINSANEQPLATPVKHSFEFTPFASSPLQDDFIH